VFCSVVVLSTDSHPFSFTSYISVLVMNTSQKHRYYFLAINCPQVISLVLSFIETKIIYIFVNFLFIRENYYFSGFLVGVLFISGIRATFYTLALEQFYAINKHKIS
jgi:hypothetical protein